MFNGQLELSFGPGLEGQRLSRGVRRMSRARWWFERMRQVVEHADEPVPVPPPEQMCFSNPSRQPAVTPESPSSCWRSPFEERQVCE